MLTTLETVKWKDIDKFIVSASKEHSRHVPDGKLTIGLSIYGLDASRSELEKTALSIKKQVKSTGRPVRIVPNKSPEISTPQIIHNKLTELNGWELVFYRNGDTTILMRTTNIQDISYTARDQARPMRDARVGMLPPKLAQIIINLATGKIEGEVGSKKQRQDIRSTDHFRSVLCSTGSYSRNHYSWVWVSTGRI